MATPLPQENLFHCGSEKIKASFHTFFSRTTAILSVFESRAFLMKDLMRLYTFWVLCSYFKYYFYVLMMALSEAIAPYKSLTLAVTVALIKEVKKGP